MNSASDFSPGHNATPAAITGLLSLVLGATVIFGWYARIPALVQIVPGLVGMVFTTALCFVLAGIALMMPQVRARSAPFMQKALGIAIVSLAGAVLAQDISGYDFGIDNFFVEPWLTASNPHPGRMAPNTAIAWMLTGWCLILVHRPTPMARFSVQILTFAVLLIALTGLIGYALNLELLYSWYRFTRMALNTAIGFLVVGIGLGSLWYRSEWYAQMYRGHEDRRISMIAAAIIIGIAVTAGLSGFALLKQQSESTIAQAFQQSLGNRVSFFRMAVAQNILTTEMVANRPYLLAQMAVLNQSPRDSIALGAVRDSLSSLPSDRFLSATLHLSDGTLVARVGTPSGVSNFVKLSGPGASELGWNGGFVQRARVPLMLHGQRVGILEAEIEAQALTEMLTQPEKLGGTAEMAICARHDRYIQCFPMRSRPRVFRIAETLQGARLPISYALHGETGVIVSKDYRGINVLATYMPIGELGLGAVLKIDTAELYAPIRNRLQQVLPLLAFLVAVGVMLLRWQIVPLVRQLVASEKMANDVSVKLRASEARMRVVVEGALDGLITINESGEVESFNSAASKIFGYAPQEVIGQNITMLMPRHMREAHLAGMRRYLLTGIAHVIGASHVELPGLRRNGTTFPLELSLSEMNEAGRRIFIGMVRDISQQKREDEERKHAEQILQRFQKALDRSVDMIAMVDPGTMKFTYVNRGGAESTGYAREELLAMAPYDLQPLYDETEYRHLVAPLLAGEREQIVFETIHRRKDGYDFPVEIALQYLKGDDGAILLSIVRDITERKKVERLKNEFVSTVSHELRTPLTSIRGSLGLINGGVAGPLPEQAQKLVSIAYNNSERLVRLINDILNIEKIESGKHDFTPTSVSVNALVEQAIEANTGYAAQFNVTILFQAGPRDFTVFVDHDRMLQVLANLLSNAIKFSLEGGQVIVRTAPQGRGVRITVCDNGVGIPDEFRDRIFHKFAQADSSDTRSKGGTGLGLSIAKAIVERSGGRISFESEPGVRTQFHVDLPEQPGAADSPAVSVADGEHRVLICEDDADIASLLAAMLLRAGFTSDVVHTASDAKARLAAARYHGLVLDLTLPDGDGVDLIRGLREGEQTHDLPIVVVSARAAEGAKALNGDAISVMDWLEKPIDEERLIQSVRRCVAATQGRKPRILHVEDDVDFARFTLILLEDLAVMDFAGTLAEARTKFSEHVFDLVVLDLELPDGDGLQLLPMLKRQTPPVPVIILSAQEVSRTVAESVSLALVKSEASNGALRDTIAQALRAPTASIG